ncbi:MAG: MBL fold metallo-hydrolase [Acidobacteria bacterium]|nr:MBL fold metallo-hydrolase [Acidobacteriota bacterium]
MPTSTFVRLSAALTLCAALACAQAPEPDGAGVEPGVLPAKWATGGPNCKELPDWEVHECNPDFYILRQSGCTHYEKPFLYLLFGKDKALLIDTGAGKPGTGAIVSQVLKRWLERAGRPSIPLVVSHSHSHGDHTAGDKDFAGKPAVELVKADPAALQKAFGIGTWPSDIGGIDLGDRLIDVLPIPGHDKASVAYYDRKTGVLLTGDSLYPGRLYIRDWEAFAESTARMVGFIDGKIVTHILGAHVEQRAQPYLDYVVRTAYQPEEHALGLSRAHLLELDLALKALGNKPRKVAYPSFTLWPREP